jgi:threonine/homoserine/homoserine lactone efflux protein
MGITATGVVSVRLALPGATPVLVAAAAAYFVYLALRIAGGMFLSLVNPKGYAAMAALFSAFVLVRERLDLDAAAKMTVLVAIIVGVNMGWLYAGAALTRCVQELRTNRAINVTFAVLLVASVAFRCRSEPLNQTKT